MKLFKLYLPLLMVLSIISPRVTLTQGLEKKLYEPKVYVSNDIIEPQISYLGEPLSEDELLFQLEELVKEAILEGESLVDVSHLGIRTDDYPMVTYLECFSPYMSDGIELSTYVDYSRQYYAFIHIQNPMTLSTTKQYFKIVEDKINTIKSLLSSSFDDEKNALILHDYLIHECEYNLEAFESGSMSGYEDSFRSGGIIMDKIGVCQGYAFAYKYFLNLVGMECHYNMSSSMVHGWNIVNIDGNYYHVDCTYDDPLPDRLSRINHNYFLKSDDYMSDHGYSGWNQIQLECDDKYDDYYFNDIRSMIIIDNNDYYYISDEGFVKSDSQGNHVSVIDNLGRWTSSEGTWPNKYASVIKYNNYIYYNTSTHIYRYHILNEEKEMVYTIEDTSTKIYGMIVLDNILYMIKKENPNVDDILVETAITFDENCEYPTYISLNKSSIYLTIGETYHLDVSLLPEYAQNKTIKWISSNEDIVSVDNGYVSAHKEGRATVTVTTQNGLSDTCEVVVEKKQEVESLVVTPQKVELQVGDIYELKVEVSPSDLKDVLLTYTSSDENVVVVDNGKLQAKGVGSAIVSVKSDNNVEAKCEVIVREKDIEVDYITLNTNTVEFNVGDTLTLIATIYPNNATHQSLKWISSNEDVVKVENGQITALSSGEAIISVKSENGKEDYCFVTVKNPMTELNINVSQLTLSINDTYQLEVTYKPENTTDSTLFYYESSDENVVSVDQEGHLKALKPGQAFIYVTNENGMSAQCQVNVIIELDDLDVEDDEFLMNIHDKVQIEVSVEPEELLEYVHINYKSRDEDIINVNDKGEIIALSHGDAYVEVSVGNLIERVHVYVEEEKTSHNTIVIDKDIVLEDTIIDKYVYIKKGCKVTIKGNVTFNKNVYVYGTLENNGILKCQANLYCLKYNSILSAGNYDYGYFINKGSSRIQSLIVKDDYLSLGIPVIEIDIESISIIKDEIELKVGQSETLEVSLLPIDATNQSLTWLSNNNDIVTVKDGVITALKAGTATITVTTSNGLSDSIKVRVLKDISFSDVSEKQWYYGVVNEAYQLGLMTGATDTLFKPNANMNRGMVSIVFHRMEGSKNVSYTPLFKDVANKQYYTTSVLWAKQTGVINGYKDGTFKPTRNVTREEMATMIYNFARYKGLDMKSSKDISGYSDYAKITPYARVTLQWAVEKGLMSGKLNGTKLDPLGTATRAECSKMLVQAYKVIYK